MEITPEQLDMICKKIGAEELKKILPEYNKVVFLSEKIYIFVSPNTSKRTVYKLHRISNDNNGKLYAWIDMETSVCFACSYSENANDMLNYAKTTGKLYVFDNYEDFIRFESKEFKRLYND